LQSLSLCIAAIAGMVRDMTPRIDKMKTAAGSGYATATDLADWLVRALGMPFRQAHHVTGRIVALAAEAGLDLEQLTLPQLQSIEPTITAEVFNVLGVEKSVCSRVSYGGTAPENVREQAKSWAHRLASDKTE
jgi:argininosuccinate lyase